MTYPYWTVAVTALVLNIPFGYIRQKCQKFSPFWFFWIHASIPVLIFLRIKLDVSPAFIPLSIFLAVVGQIWGGRWRKARQTEADIEQYERIQDLNVGINEPKPVYERDVMIVLMNMGGPRTNTDVPDFQRRLFNDPLLIRFPLSKLLQPFFAWLLVKLRGKETQKRYQLIGGGSPIFDSTRAQARALQDELRQRSRACDVTFSFNYSEPLPEQTMEEIKSAGKKYILPLSLYPHYSSATTGANIHYLKEAARKLLPDLKFLKSSQYHTHTGYLQGFVERIHEQLKPGENLDEFYLIFSAHGLPLYFLLEGDPYPFQISQTVGGILSKLNRQHAWTISY